MASLRVDSFTFNFRANIDARKYDAFTYYRTVLRADGNRAVDVTAVQQGNHPNKAWLIEAKDYRILRGQPKAITVAEMAEDFYRKVCDTEAGLHRVQAEGDPGPEQDFSIRFLRVRLPLAVLHLEPYGGRATKLFPRDPSVGVQQKLKQMFKPSGRQCIVLNISRTKDVKVPWTVS